MASYFQRPLNADTIPNFITSETARGLRRKMSKNNILQKGYVYYHHIQWVESEGLWYAWFDVALDNPLDDVLDTNKGVE